MYTQIRDSLAAAGRMEAEATSTAARAPRVSRNVVFLGLTSFFTDISAEMVSTVLPIYLLFTLRIAAVQLGVVDGLYQGVTALVQLGAGGLADRGRHKEVAAAGYAISALGKLGLIASGGALAPLTAIILADRAGKGIRTAPRDALISLSSEPQNYGAAFGVHRALDTAGALLGPIVAFALLTLLPGRFDAIFVVSACFAGLGLAVLLLLVQGRRAAGRERPAFSLRAALRLLRQPGFRVLVLAGGGLGLATISDAFVYLTLQRRVGFDARFLPLLFVATAFGYLVLAAPMGRVADRFGRRRVFVGGYCLLVLVYLALLAPGVGTALIVAVLVAFGAYYACTDGVMSALASDALPEMRRATGLALLLSVIALSRLVGSIAFGAVWTLTSSVQAATELFLVALVVILPVTAIGLARTVRSGR